MHFTHNFYSAEESCERKTTSILKTNLGTLEEILNFYYKIFDKQINDGKKLSLQDFSVVIIHLKIIKTMHCLIGLLKKGNYCEFQSLLRDVFELTYLAEYLMKNPEKVPFWLDGEAIKFRQVAKNLDLCSEDQAMYGMLCDFTHPNFYGIKSNIIIKPCPNIDFKIAPEFHKPTAKMQVVIHAKLTLDAINSFYNYFKKYNTFNIDDEKQLKKIESQIRRMKKAWIKYSSQEGNESFTIDEEFH